MHNVTLNGTKTQLVSILMLWNDHLITKSAIALHSYSLSAIMNMYLSLYTPKYQYCHSMRIISQIVCYKICMFVCTHSLTMCVDCVWSIETSPVWLIY